MRLPRLILAGDEGNLIREGGFAALSPGKVFVRLLHHEDAIWLGQGEDELERALQGSMGAIVDKVMTTWSTMVTPSQPDPHYLIERNLIPRQLQKYIDGYCCFSKN